MICQDKNLTTGTFALSPAGVLSRQNPYHKHLRTITARRFAKTKTLPQAPTKYLHKVCELSLHVICQNHTTSTCELSPPRVVPRQKPYHKHLQTITATRCIKTKSLTTGTYELSPPGALPRQQPYNKLLRTITAMRFAKTKTFLQSPANYYRRAFCQDKNLM